LREAVGYVVGQRRQGEGKQKWNVGIGKPEMQADVMGAP
jgi:hypothetical protein